MRDSYSTLYVEYFFFIPAKLFLKFQTEPKKFPLSIFVLPGGVWPFLLNFHRKPFYRIEKYLGYLYDIQINFHL
jgi:hypothetical protein